LEVETPMDNPQGLLQQMNARPHSGEYLEVLGKRASARWHAGEYKNLSEAVTGTVKQAQLSPEQVKRVCEFANTAAYLDEFKKEGGTHHVVDFPGGPANASDILKDLNDGGGGSVFDRGTLDYSSPPRETKTASAREDGFLEEAFGIDKTAEQLPYENPHAEVIDLKDKLAGAAAHLQDQTSGLEIMYADLSDRVYQQVKQASLGGVALGKVLTAWGSVAPSDDYIKVAFELFTPRLLREGVFHSVEEMTASVDKTAAAGMVNPEHPLVVDFGEFCDVLAKLAETRAAREELVEHIAHLETYLQKAASTVGKVWGAAKGTARSAAEASRPFLKEHLGETAGGALATGIAHLPHAGVLVGGLEANRRIQNSQSAPARAARAVGRGIARQIPGTDANLNEQYRLQSGG
jgi:hypothetical protein